MKKKFKNWIKLHWDIAPLMLFVLAFIILFPVFAYDIQGAPIIVVILPILRILLLLILLSSPILIIISIIRTIKVKKLRKIWYRWVTIIAYTLLMGLMIVAMAIMAGLSMFL